MFPSPVSPRDQSGAKPRRNKLLASQRRRRSLPGGLERLEERTLLAVSILNGGGLGYVGNGGPSGPPGVGPPDETGAAGPNSYMEVNNSTITLYSPKSTRTILATHSIRDFFFNPAIGNQTQIALPFSGQLIPIAASPTGATEAGTTVTITTTVTPPFSKGQTVQVSGVGVAGYNGVFAITGVSGMTFTYTAPTAGLANSGGGTASVDPGSCKTCDSTGVFDNLMGPNGRFIIGDIDVDLTTGVSQYLFAVSVSSNPASLTDPTQWNFYHVTTTGLEAGQGYSDYPGNPGFNADAFVETFDMLNGTTQVVSIKASDIAAGNPLVTSGAGQNVFRVDLSDGLNGTVYRPTTMHDSVPGDPMWLIQNPNDGTHIRVVKMTNVLTGPTFDGSASDPGTKLALPMPDQFIVSGGIGNPLNADNTGAIDGDDDAGEQQGGLGAFDPGNRILKAGEWNNIILAAHSVAVNSGSPYTLASAQANGKNGPPNTSGGSGYTVGDVLTLTGGTSSTAAQVTVQTVNASGGITSVTVTTPGSYSDLSGTGGVMGGTGTGASFSFFWTGELAAQWYAIDVSSGSPVFQMVGGSQNIGREAFGANTYCYEPAIDINSKGQIGLGFMESDTTGGAINPATGGWISTFVTARNPTDAAGMMATPVLVSAGKGTAAITGRIGDFSGMNVDPVNGTFWHSNEFGGGGPTVIANFTPDIAPTLTPPTAPQTSVEGASQSFSLGSFADPDGGPWTVDVSWGDGTPDTIFTAAAPGPITPQSHTYGEEGAYTGTITVTDTADGQFDSNLFSVNVADAALSPANPQPTVSATEGTTTGLVPIATFTDANPSAPITDFTATIDWGDSSLTSLGLVTESAGVFTVSGAHTYSEESTNLSPPTYKIIVNIVDDGGSRLTTTTTASVADAALSPANPQPSVAAVEGQRFSNVPVSYFIDANPLGTVGDFSASIAWGLNANVATTTGVVQLIGHTAPGAPISGIIFQVLGSNTYTEEGSSTITVTINDVGGSTVTTTTTATTVDAPLTGSAGNEITGIEGSSTGTVMLGTFIDANQAATVADYTAGGGSVVVNWGDGSAPQTLAASNLAAIGTPNGVEWTINAAHTPGYPEEGTYAYTVTVTDDGGAETTVDGSAIIADAKLSYSAQKPINQDEPTIFPLPVFAPPAFNPADGPVATFTDANPTAPVSDFKATIDWGDGTPESAGTVTQPGGAGTAFDVFGSHTYADAGTTGKYNIQVLVTDIGGSKLTIPNVANVTDNPINVTGILNPLSDSGLSTGTSDVTNVTQPDFFGTVWATLPSGATVPEAYAHVSLTATNLITGVATSIGTVQAGSDGSWNIKSTVALADGRYSITAAAVDQFGQTTTAAPDVITSPLLIDTTGPKIDGMFFNRLNGQVDYIIKDPVNPDGSAPSGVWVNTLLDSSNYLLTKVHGNKAYPGKWVVTDVTAAPDPTIANAFDVAVTFNSGATLKGGFYLFTIRDSSNGNSSVQDRAENHLDGEFYGSFPSGNGINGSDFVAELQAVHNKVFAPQTIIGTAFPGNGGDGGPAVAPVHSGIWVPAVPVGGSPIFSTSTSPSNGADPPAHKVTTKTPKVTKLVTVKVKLPAKPELKAKALAEAKKK